MNNFCVCGTGDYDFDASDYENYWRCESAVVPEGTKCCECGAAIPAGGRRSCATHYEVYEPEGEPPCPDEDELSPAEFDARMDEYDTWRDDHGWDDETERYVRETSTAFRCDRCEAEVEILAQFDICVSAPGELPGAHEEHYWHKHKRRIRWRAGPDGVPHFQPWRLIDYARHYRRQAYYRIRREWSYEFRYRLRRVFMWPIERALSHAIQREKLRLWGENWRWQRGAR